MDYSVCSSSASVATYSCVYVIMTTMTFALVLHCTVAVVRWNNYSHY